MTTAVKGVSNAGAGGVRARVARRMHPMMESVDPVLQTWLVFGVVILAIAAYSYDRIPLEISGLTTVAVLLIIFTLLPLPALEGLPELTPRSLLAGFADPALITIMALLVIGQGLLQTGALSGIARLVVDNSRRAPRLVLMSCLVGVMLVSAVLNNTPVVVMFIPILAALAERIDQSPAKVMIPLSFAAILGGNLTVIGSSTNLLAVGAFTLSGGPRIGFFDFTIPGLVLAAAGLTYILFIAPLLLSNRQSEDNAAGASGGKQFLFQVELTADSKLVGHTAVAGMFPDLKNLTIRLIQRGGEDLLPPYDGVTLTAGDMVMAAATRSVMTELLSKDRDVVANAEGENEEDEAATERQLIAEAIVAPASRMDGRTLAQTGFKVETGCAVLGIQRRSRMIRSAISQLRIEAGDVLLVMGNRKDVLGLRRNRDVILLESSATDLPMTEYGSRAGLIFAAVVTLAATGLIPIAVTALGGAVAMMVSGCLNVRQASRAIDRRVWVIVGAALALGTAMQGTGGAHWLAASVVNLMSGAPPALLLSVFFLLIAMMTNILSNNAAAVLFTPIALSIAGQLHVDPMPFLLAVIFGANCSFATPMSYQTNLLVMVPGHYKFTDFVRVGTPLIFICWLAFTMFVPWYYNLL